MSGKVDAVVGDEPVLRYYINNYGLSNKYSVLSNPIYTKKQFLLYLNNMKSWLVF